MSDLDFPLVLPVRSQVACYAGDDRAWGLRFAEKDTAGTVTDMDLTGVHTAHVKTGVDDAAPVLSIAVDAADAATGEVRWSLTAAQTAGLAGAARTGRTVVRDGRTVQVADFVWDSQVVLTADGTTVTLARGPLTVEKDVTVP